VNIQAGLAQASTFAGHHWIARQILVVFLHLSGHARTQYIVDFLSRESFPFEQGFGKVFDFTSGDRVCNELPSFGLQVTVGMFDHFAVFTVQPAEDLTNLFTVMRSVMTAHAPRVVTPLGFLTCKSADDPIVTAGADGPVGIIELNPAQTEIPIVHLSGGSQLGIGNNGDSLHFEAQLPVDDGMTGFVVSADDEIFAGHW
jgi:hypothetical protein